MRGATETPKTAQIRVENPYDLLRKTATPQVLPAILRRQTSLTPASVQIIVAPTAAPALSLLESRKSLFPIDVLNQTTSLASEPEADWRTHALLSDIPDLSARLSNLDREVKAADPKSADSTTQVLRMHNAVLESHDAGLEQQKAASQAAMQRCDDLQARHAQHTSSTREYLTKTQDILEAHEDRLADLLDAHEAHASSSKDTMDLLDATHTVLDSHETSIASLHDLHEKHTDLLRGMSTKAEASQEYLTMAQGMLESHDDSIHALREATRSNAQLLQQLSQRTNAGADKGQYGALADNHENTMQYLTLNQGMMETFHRSIDGLQETSKTHAKLVAGLQSANSELQSANSELRDSLNHVHDELDALHAR